MLTDVEGKKKETTQDWDTVPWREPGQLNTGKSNYIFEEKILTNKICPRIVDEITSEHLRQNIKRTRHPDISCGEILIMIKKLKDSSFKNAKKRIRKVCKRGQNWSVFRLSHVKYQKIPEKHSENWSKKSLWFINF